MNILIHKSEERGHANHGWLNAKHSFSFASYYNPDKVHFGMLRVLNDDIVAPGMGFGSHPHDNMEIITIPLTGALEHKDSMGNTGVINANEVQIMSAGSGIMHSEFNHNKDKEINLLQTWIFTKSKDIAPRYAQKSFSAKDYKNNFFNTVAPIGSGKELEINQDAWFYRGVFEKGLSPQYKLNNPAHGVYMFVIEGEVKLNGTVFNKRDAAGLTETQDFTIEILQENTDVLLIEVPIN